MTEGDGESVVRLPVEGCPAHLGQILRDLVRDDAAASSAGRKGVSEPRQAGSAQPPWPRRTRPVR